MTLGAARAIFTINDLSQFVDELVKGYVFMVIQAERGPIGEPRVISTLEEYRRIYGGKVPWTTDPLVCEMALRQGGRLILCRAAHYDDIHDISTITALKSNVSLDDRGAIPLAAMVTGAVGPFTLSPAKAGAVTGGEVGPFLIVTGANDAFKIKVGTHDAETVTLTQGSARTAQQIVDDINAGTTNLTASISDNKVKITANTVTDDLEIQTVANDSYSSLGFVEGTFAADAGTDALAISVNGGADQPFTLTPLLGETGNFTLTASQVATQLAALTGARASVVNGAVRLTTTATGETATIQVKITGTAQTTLGFVTTEQTGATGSSLPTLKFEAKDPGLWGDSLKIQISDSNLFPGIAFNVKVIYERDGTLTEDYADLVMDSTSLRYAPTYISERSRLVVVTDLDSANTDPANMPLVNLYGTPLTGGDDGGDMEEADWIGDATAQTGMYSADRNFYMSMDLMIPGTTSVTVYQAMIAYCESRGDMISYGQVPFGMEPEEVVDWRLGNAPWSHPAFNSHRFSIFFGFPKVYDDMDDSRKFVSCLGHLASCLAKTDNNYGYHYSPVGPRRGKVTLMEDIDFNIQAYRSTGYADLFAENGINYLFISHMPGIEGGMFWEQRTSWRPASALRELNVVRFITAMNRMLMPVLRTFIFEPNHPVTWREIWRVLKPAFDDWKSRYAIYDYALQCDEDAYFDGGVLKNAKLNSGLDIDRGIYHCRALNQPTRTIYYLEFELGLIRTGEAFENYLELKELPGWIVT